jgi:hypothetical protein
MADKPPAKIRPKLMNKEVSIVLILFRTGKPVRAGSDFGPQPF